ncbi:MAG TPA: O-methyltransferase [bacterium]
MEIISSEITRYLDELLPVRDPILVEMEKLAEERKFPIVGPLVGRLCFQLVKLTNAASVFEMGSGFGYSAYWMGLALPAAGKIICTEKSSDNIKLARDYFRRGGLADKVELLQGNALDIIEEFDRPFDVILNDINKVDYPKSLDLILPRLRAGGVLITDNLLWHGRVAQPNPDADTRGVLEYSRMIYSHPQLLTTLIPLRDGVGVTLKLA